jgi:hypothetical protein
VAGTPRARACTLESPVMLAHVIVPAVSICIATVLFVMPITLTSRPSSRQYPMPSGIDENPAWPIEMSMVVGPMTICGTSAA